MRAGFYHVVPAAVAVLFEWYELESIVAGRRILDAHLLQSLALYGSGLRPSDTTVIHFWHGMRLMSRAESLQVLHMMSGRTSYDRTLVADDEFIGSIGDGLAGRPVDSAHRVKLLPSVDGRMRVDRAEFALQIPEFESAVHAREQLLQLAYVVDKIDRSTVTGAGSEAAFDAVSFSLLDDDMSEDWFSTGPKWD